MIPSRLQIMLPVKFTLIMVVIFRVELTHDILEHNSRDVILEVRHPEMPFKRRHFLKNCPHPLHHTVYKMYWLTSSSGAHSAHSGSRNGTENRT